MTMSKEGVAMDGVTIIGFLDGGLMACWLGGNIMRGEGFGFFMNLILGMGGAFLGGSLLNALGIVSGSFVGALATGTVAGGMLLFIAGRIKVFGRAEVNYGNKQSGS